MCLATPMKIKEIKGLRAIVGDDKHSHEIDLSLIKESKIGDYVLAHGDMAINKVAPEEAKKILKIINEKNRT
jgi:hydrogenase assembly chaperone HypC/HupF